MDGSKTFGLELLKALNARQWMETDLVRAMLARGNEIGRSYVSMMCCGNRIPPPETVDKLADALKLSTRERTVLHRAAAIDSGYKIGILR